MQNESNMKCCQSTWNEQNNSSIDFRACLGRDFGFMLDLEHVHFQVPPKSDNHNNSNYSDVKGFDGSSCIVYAWYILRHNNWLILVQPFSLFPDDFPLGADVGRMNVQHLLASDMDSFNHFSGRFSRRLNKLTSPNSTNLQVMPSFLPSTRC